MKLKISVYILCVFFFIKSNHLFAQNVSEQHLDVKIGSYFSSEEQLPFWLWANQMGKIREQGKFQQVGLANYYGSLSDSSHHLKIRYGVSLAGSSARGISKGPKTELQLNEAYVSVSFNKMFLKVGEKAAETQLSGLSATNGDFDYSNNSRPYPSIQFGTNGYLKFFKNFYFSAVWEEALIRDQYEFIKNPNLHHKNLFIRWGKPKKIRITAGLDDYAWWGGTSPNPEYGKLPNGLSDYLRVITSRPGGQNAVAKEQDNAAGNHVGQYKLTIEKEINNQFITFYLCHPIEDQSGVKWQNYQDNMYGFFWNENQKKTLISSVLFEFYYTRNQNVHPSNLSTPPIDQMPLNYFNNYIYESGYTYKGNVIGAPLFYPVRYNSDGKVTGVANNRFYAFHCGIGGSIVPKDQYKILLTYSVNSGLWDSYPGKLKRFSSLFEYTYTWKKNIGLNGGLASDFMHQEGKSWDIVGGYVGINWKIIP